MPEYRSLTVCCDWGLNLRTIGAFALNVTFWVAVFGSTTACAETPSAIAIKDARVVTVSGAELAKGTVLLRGGLIQDVGVDLPIPADAWIVEGAGLTVYPGFIDGLSTWGI